MVYNNNPMKKTIPQPILSIGFILFVTLALTGCVNKINNSNNNQLASSSAPLVTSTAEENANFPTNSLNTSKEKKFMEQSATRQTVLQPSFMKIDPAKKYTAVLQTTVGTITIILNAKDTPKTVNNFVYLANNKFYNTTIFHRVIKDFMIQGGDPNGNGTGGPGYKFNDEPFSGSYDRGTVAMANSGPNTNGSQFFIMHQANPLPKNYVIFGKVIEGLDVVDKIAQAPVAASPSGEASQPVDPVTITSVQIIKEG